MKTALTLIVLLTIGATMAWQSRTQNVRAQSPATQPAIPPEIAAKLVPDSANKVHLTPDEWRKILTPEQFQILREGGTECAFDNAFFANKDAGIYLCAGCGQELFVSDHKFESGTGWPSFFQAVNPKAVINVTDRTHGMVRTQITCSRCDGHLGHVFEDGPKPTGLRYCVDSASLRFIPNGSPATQPAG